MVLGFLPPVLVLALMLALRASKQTIRVGLAALGATIFVLFLLMGPTPDWFIWSEYATIIAITVLIGREIREK